MNRSNGIRFTFSWYKGTEHTTSATATVTGTEACHKRPEARTDDRQAGNPGRRPAATVCKPLRTKAGKHKPVSLEEAYTYLMKKGNNAAEPTPVPTA